MGNAPTEAPGRAAGDAFGVAAAVDDARGLFEYEAPSDARAREVETERAGEDGFEFTAGSGVEALSPDFSCRPLLVPAAGGADGVLPRKRLARGVDGGRTAAFSVRWASTSPTNCDALCTA